MDLIIKPTELCNCACTFCSSTDITDDKKDVLNLDYIARFLDRFPNTNTIIVNGGDPLMLKPDYYWDILRLLEEREMFDTSIGFTTNLWTSTNGRTNGPGVPSPTVQCVYVVQLWRQSPDLHKPGIH